MIGKRQVAQDITATLVPNGYQLDRMHIAPERDPETGKIKDISIEVIRDLKSWITLTPTGTHKVVIIDDADRLGAEAANTLLKVLEEPPAYAHFFLISSQPGQLLQTVLSRCERVDFRLLGEKESVEVLAGMRLAADDQALLAVVAGGKPGLAAQLLQNKQLPRVAQAIGALEKTLKGGIAEKLLYAKQLADDESAPQIVSWWVTYVATRLSQKPHLAGVLQGLLEVHATLGQSHYNRRLALEKFFLSTSLQNK